MNIGFPGEGFPYTNFHDMNLDWMIKIAKDFLDQYTHIQEVIAQGLIDLQDKTDTGLEALQTKYETLEGLLDAWYTEHSEDIADQLAGALADLNSWYDTHQGFLDGYVDSAIAEFNTAAETKAADTIASIPDDYTDLSNTVLDYSTAVCEFLRKDITIDTNGITGYIHGTDVVLEGTATANTGIQVINSIIDPELFRLNSFKGKKLFLKLKNVDSNEHIEFTIAYKATSGSTWTELLRVDSRDLLTHEYMGSFTMPSSFYQFMFSVTLYNTWVYNSNFVMSLQNADIMYTLSDDSDARLNREDIIRLENKMDETDYYYTKYTANEDGAITQDGLTITKNGSEIIFTGGNPSANGAFNIIQSSTAFKPNEDFYIHFDTDNNRLYLQVSAVLVYGGTPVNLLTANESGVYKVTAPASFELITVYITYLSLGTYNNNMVNVIVSNYNSESRRIFRTSQFSNSIIATVKEAQKYYGSIVLLDSGSYDMVDDFVNYYGETFFENYTPLTIDGYGLVITNGMTLRGQSDTVIVCDPADYITESNKIYLNFSPFMMGGDDCTIESVTIDCANTKYCIHDDWGTKADKYRHIIRNCKLSHLGSGLRCIGGGFTKASECIIEGCYLYSALQPFPVHYHNNGSSTSKSSLYMTNNYFLNGGLGLANYGPSTVKSVAFVSGNSYENDPVIEYLDPDTYPNENMECVKWNNEKRN